MLTCPYYTPINFDHISPSRVARQLAWKDQEETTCKGVEYQILVITKPYDNLYYFL